MSGAWTDPRERSEAVSTARAAIAGFAIPHGPQRELEIAIEELALTAIKTRGLPQRGVNLFGPSFAGKSTAARRYAAKVLSLGQHRSGTVPIAVATVDPEGSLASMATDVLRALGEPRPDKGSTALRWERATQALRRKEVQVLVLDEFQRANRRPTMSPVIAARIQDIMEAGLCAVAFLGLESAREILRGAKDLANRLDAPVTMPPLRYSDPYERDLFHKFASQYDDALVKAGVTQLRSGFADDENLQVLMESSGGLIGHFARIVETAALANVRRRLPAISRQDMADAVDEWAIANNRIGYNPYLSVTSDAGAEDNR